MFKKPCYWLEQLNSQSPLRPFVAWETIKRNEKTFNDQCDKSPFTLFYTRTVDKVLRNIGCFDLDHGETFTKT